MTGRRGRGWEARLKVWHDQYRRQGVAYVVQTSAPIKRVGETGRPGDDRFEAVFSSAGPPDFVGVARIGESGLGRAVVFDAKETDESRWRTDRLLKHQAADLDAATRAGALAFVALRLGAWKFGGVSGDFTREWVVPWNVLRGYWPRGSLGLAELQMVGVPFGADGWLSALRDDVVDPLVLPGEGDA